MSLTVKPNMAKVVIASPGATPETVGLPRAAMAAEAVSTPTTREDKGRIVRKQAASQAEPPPHFAKAEDWSAGPRSLGTRAGVLPLRICPNFTLVKAGREWG